MDSEIKRDYYLEQLIKRQHNGLIKVITGIRRCGKSYLLRTLFKKLLLENGVIHGHWSRLKTGNSIIFCLTKFRCLENL